MSYVYFTIDRCWGICGLTILNGSDTCRRNHLRTLTCGIAVMAKASARGQAKTRLAPPLTLDEAAEFNTAFLRDIADNLLAAGSQAPIKGLMAFGPPGSEDFFTAIMPREIGLMECWFPDFGACLSTPCPRSSREGYASGVVLNADSPTLPAAYLAEAAQLLARPGDRAVLGPSSDGGYYLLGLKEPHRRLFEDIAWSTERVAEQTIERAHEIGLPIHALPTWYDIDDRAISAHAARRIVREPLLRRAHRRLRPRITRRPSCSACSPTPISRDARACRRDRNLSRRQAARCGRPSPQ